MYVFLASLRGPAEKPAAALRMPSSVDERWKSTGIVMDMFVVYEILLLLAHTALRKYCLCVIVWIMKLSPPVIF